MAPFGKEDKVLIKSLYEQKGYRFSEQSLDDE